MPVEAIIRKLSTQDEADLSYLINHSEYIYRHLDWRSAMAWLGSQPFLGFERSHRLVAALACPQDETSIRWVRLFAYLNWNARDMEGAWLSLFQMLQDAHAGQDTCTFAALGLSPWFTDLLEISSFQHTQDIIVLLWDGKLPADRPFPREIRIRPMHSSDLNAVAALDQVSFAPLWHQTRADLEQALGQAAYATVAILENEIIGYQISTSTPFHAHLARLAVHPELQRLSIGYGIVREMIENFTRQGTTNITVNTQSDNFSSQKLYEKLGFYRTGEAFPVYTLSCS